MLPPLIYRAAGAMGDNGWFMGALSFSPTKAYVKSFFLCFQCVTEGDHSFLAGLLIRG